MLALGLANLVASPAHVPHLNQTKMLDLSASLLLGAGGANLALELDHPKYKTVIAAAAHFAQINGGNDGNDGCLRLLIKALQRGHALGQSLPLSAVRFRHSPCVPPHLAHLVRVSQWERRSRWPRADTGSKACVAACTATM